MMVRGQRRQSSKAAVAGALCQSIKSPRRTIFSRRFENLDLISQNQRPGLELVEIENASSSFETVKEDNGLSGSKLAKVAADN